jgi:hypothetical protein
MELIVPSDTMNNYYDSPEGEPIYEPLGTPIPEGMASAPRLSKGDPVAIAYLAPAGFGGDYVEVFNGNVWDRFKETNDDNKDVEVAFVAGTTPDFAGSGDSGGGLFVQGKHYGNNWSEREHYEEYGWLCALNP